MKKLGIIGGFGPETTAKFQLRIIKLIQETTAKHRPAILSWNTPISLDLENQLVLHGKQDHKIVPLLLGGAKILESAGCDFLTLPCNTLHVHLETIRQNISVPILSIIDESILFLKKCSIKRICILATSITIGSKMHLRKMVEAGIEPIFPNAKQQLKLNQIIHNLVTGKSKDSADSEIKKIMADLSVQSDNNFLLACTDLQLIDFKDSDFNVIDSLEILAIASANHLTKKRG